MRCVVPKLAITLALNTQNLFLFYGFQQTLHYLTIMYCHTYYERALPCVLSVTSEWRQSLH